MAERPDTSSISAALGEATPGRWWHQVTTACFDVIEGGDRTSDSHYIAMMGTDYDGHDTQDAPNVRADAHLIANAPHWLAQLLGALEAAEAALAEAEEKLSGRYIAAMEAAQRIDDLEYENRALRTRISLAIGRIERGEPGAALTGLQAALVNAEMGDEQ